jgi:peptide deformylase
MKLVKTNNPILHTKTEPLSRSDIFTLEKLSCDMLEFMSDNKAIGLAAPQIGLAHRLFVMEPNRRVFNPEILNQSEDEKLYEEGCLSFPGMFMKVKRPLWVDVRYKTVTDGNIIDVEETLRKIDCQCFCHELDHLNGITFDQRVSKLVLKRAKEKLKK